MSAFEQSFFRSARESLGAWYFARKFKGYTRGEIMTLATGERLSLKIESVKPYIKHRGYRFYKYAYITTMTANGIRESGCGESNSKLLAIEKSIAEAVERVAYRALKGTSFGSLTSSGWAAHRTPSMAEVAAFYEMIERDASLLHWFTRTPLMEIKSSSLPNWLTEWRQRELSQSQFPILRILCSTAGHLPTVTSVLLNREGFGVASHAAGPNLDSAIERATAEACRLAQMAEERLAMEGTRRLFLGDTDLKFDPVHHAVAYAYHRTMPSWIFGDTIGWTDAKRSWTSAYKSFNAKSVKYEFELVGTSSLFVGRCESQNAQNLFFGPTDVALSQKLVNTQRLAKFQASFELNHEPHFVA